MASGLVNYCGGLGVCRLVLGVQSQAPHCGTYMPMGSRPSGQLASETPVEDRAIACGKEGHFCGVIHRPKDPLLLCALGQGRLSPGYNSKS